MTGSKTIRYAGMVTALLALAAGSLRADSVADALNGKLVQQKGGALVLAAPDALAGKTIIALYYSTYGPVCRKFSPDLLQFYHAAVGRFPNFQLVMLCRYAPAFPAEKGMNEYIVKEGLDWPILTFSDAANIPLAQKFAASSVPYLVIIDAQGNKLIETQPGENASSQALDALQKLLENSPDAAVAAVPAPSAPAPAKAPAVMAAPAAPASPIGPGDYYIDSQGTEYMPGYQPPGTKLMHRAPGGN